MPPVKITVSGDLVWELDVDPGEVHLRATPANLEKVSQIYRALVESGEVAPTGWLAERLYVPHFTAARLITKAREEGFPVEA